jgi:hypothetical protein
VTVSFLEARRFPVVGLQNPIDIGFAVNLDVVTSLMDVKPIVLEAKTTGTRNTHALVESSDALIDESDQFVSSSRIKSSNGEIVDLATDEDVLAIERAAVEVALVSGAMEAKIFNQDAGDHFLPKASSFRMALESTEDRNDQGTTIENLVEALQVPRSICVVDLQEAGNRRRR